MKTTSTLLLFLSITLSAFSQKKLAEVSDHYKSLQQFSRLPSQTRSWMDTIQYPASEYGNSLVYLLVKPFYLSDSEVKVLTHSVVFPVNSSDRVREELDYLLELQNKRTSEQIKRVEFLANIGYWPSINLLPSHSSYQQNLKDLFFEGREVLGKEVTPENFPNISKLLQGVMQDMRVMEFTIKYKYLRPRPYHLEPKLESLAKINSPSFVSGHTLWAFIQAYTWSEIVPEKEKEFISLAEEIRRSREIMGIHFPSDNEAARQVAYRMIQYYFKNEVFQKDFKNAKAEWKSKSPSSFK